MNDFVEQCRQEWRRLGVSDRPADEMAADLAADLAEAEAEGISAEEFLGSSALDPRSFAASWAAERGLIPEPSSRRSDGRRPRVLIAFTAFAAITMIVAALLLATGEPKVSLVRSRTTPRHLVSPPAGVSPHVTAQSVVSASAAAPVEWILLFLAIVALGFATWLWLRWGRLRGPGALA
jgi:hypothetical protein